MSKASREARRREREIQGRVPWYVVAWRLPWAILAQVLRVLFVLVILIGWGRWEARSAWEWTQ